MAKSKTGTPFDAMGTPFDAMGAPFQAMAEGVNGPFGELLRANAEAGRDFMEGCGRITQELMNFSSTRMQQDLRNVQRLAECRDYNEALQVQADCVASMMQAYMDEMTRLYEMAGDTGEACMSKLDESLQAATGEAAGPSGDAKGQHGGKSWTGAQAAE